ncbi:MAG: L,D-transpeptidase [Clostridiales bacterium]|nr:L,D-transpeptidase [Clostridiales bacterium]
MKKLVLVALIISLLPATVALADENTSQLPSTYSCGKEHCYWETPMDISDPQAVWAMLTQPMTYVKGNQRKQVQLRAEPNKKAEVVGEVTCESQGVHVLEHLPDGWSYVECYTSAGKSSRVDVYNEMVRGYLPTELLKERKSSADFGLVVDKLVQRMYVFRNGELLTTLRVSTGGIDEDHPSQQTNAGEFHLVSYVGDFVSDNGAICSDAIRFNDGDLIHEVPYFLDEDAKPVYWYMERFLGQPASEGCIRVQRRRSPEGVNMNWLWGRMFGQKNIRLAIWEAQAGRSLPTPAADTPLYYSPQQMDVYHRTEECYRVGTYNWPMIGFTYGELEEEPYAAMIDCDYCNPPMRTSQLQALREQYGATE